MSILSAVSAFAHRAARRSEQAQLVVYSFGLAAFLGFLSLWIVVSAEAPPGGTPYDFDNAPPVPPPLAWSVVGLADLFALAVLALGLFVIAPAAVAAAVAGERRAGTLDQLRTTPLSPIALVAALVAGAPARVYFLMVGPLAIHVAAVATGNLSPATFVASLGVLAAGTLAAVLFGLVVSLASKQEAGTAQAALTVALILGGGGLLAICATFERGSTPWSFMHPAGALSAALLEHDGLYRRLFVHQWSLQQFAGEARLATLALQPLLSAVAALALSAILAAAACRRLARPYLPLLSKPQALAIFAGIVVAVIAPLRSGSSDYIEIVPAVFVLELLLAPLVAVLGLLAAPSFEAWAIALRRRDRTGLLSDAAAPHAITWAMQALIVVAVPVLLGGHGRLREFDEEKVIRGAIWAVAGLASLPVFLHFLATRYATPTARGAFGAAVMVHLVLQVVCVVAVIDSERAFRESFVQAGAMAGVLVPMWVAWRQRALRLRTLAA